MSMKDYLREAQLELFIFSIMKEFMLIEGYTLPANAQQDILEKSMNVIKTLGFDKMITVDSDDVNELKNSINILIELSVYLFSLFVMKLVREERYKELIDLLKDKKL